MEGPNKKYRKNPFKNPGLVSGAEKHINYINTREKPGELSGVNMISSHVKLYILLDVLLCSIAEYFCELCGILTSP